MVARREDFYGPQVVLDGLASRAVALGGHAAGPVAEMIGQLTLKRGLNHPAAVTRANW